MSDGIREGVICLPKSKELSVAVVIPAFRAELFILDVLDRVPARVKEIFVIDDCCPNSTGEVALTSPDPRVNVVRNATNLGVGGATKVGIRLALEKGHDIIAKIDADGQIDPKLIIPALGLIDENGLDFVKGSRFHHHEDLRGMPFFRLIGNSALTLISRISTGYWKLNDPTNGFIVLTASLARKLRLGKISDRYFFESDLIFRLGLVGARLGHLPMKATYATEKSGLSLATAVPTFLVGHLRNLLKRIALQYFVLEWNAGTLFLTSGAIFGTIGTIQFSTLLIEMSSRATAAPAGTVMLAAVPLILGYQSLLSFLAFDSTRYEVRTPAPIG